MIRCINRFLSTYGYDSISDFFLSICPSFKYELHLPAISLSTITAVISHWVGLTPFLAFAMLIAIVAEMWSGIRASIIKGDDFDSFKFSRCIIKLCIWLTIIYIVHSFWLECRAGEQNIINYLSCIFFYIVKVFVMTSFCVEHIVSILENLAIIDGKPKNALIAKIQSLWGEFTNKIKKKNNEV